MSTRRSTSGKRFSAIQLAVFASLGAASAFAATQTSTWIGPGGDTWSALAAWLPAGVPNNNTNGFSDYNVIIGAPAPAILDISPTIDNLTINVGGTLGIQFNSALNLNGATQIDNGSIVINSNSGGAVAELNFDFVGATQLTGAGTITLQQPGTNAQLNTGAGDTLTQSSTHTIAGYGNISAALTNNGTITANVSATTLNLLSDNVTNNATFSAANGGALTITGITVTQGTAGKINVATGSALNLSAATIVGGTINTAGTGSVNLIDNSVSTFSNVTSNSTVNVPFNHSLGIVGNLVDNGTVIVNSDEGGAIAAVNFNGGTLSGTGTFVLEQAADNAQINGTLTQAAGHSITGFGQINAAFTNNGIVNANISGGLLTLATSNQTNNATIEATNGGSLSIDSITLTQGTAGQINVATGGDLLLSSATIIGGKVSTVGTGEIDLIDNSISTFSGVTSNSTINVPYDHVLGVVGNLVDNGTVNINSNMGGAIAQVNFSGGTLSGTGTFVLEQGSDNAQINGTLNQASGHSITGYGQINAALTNNGIVNANIDGQILTLATSNQGNNATIEATNGGELDINGITLTQSAGGSITAAASSIVSLINGPAVSGGSITATSGTLDLAGGAVITNSAISATNSTINIPINSNGTSGFAATISGGTFSMSAGSTLNEQYGNAIEFNLPTLTDNGSIVVNSNQGGAVAEILIGANTLLTGSGTLTLQQPDLNAQLDTAAAFTLTQDVHHTIAGYGDIQATLINNGTVTANVSTQTLNVQSDNVTNNATFSAVNGGILSINGIVATNTNGSISAGNGSQVTLSSATITGGTLSSAANTAVSPAPNNQGFFEILGSTTWTSLTNDAVVLLPYDQSLSINGNLVDNGTVFVNSNVGGAVAAMNFSGGTVSGTGTFVLQQPSDNAQINGTLTQSVGHSITGYGQINAAFTNNGLVNANFDSGLLTLTGNPMTNNGTIEATNGGSLLIDSITVTQGTAGQINVATGSDLQLSSTTIVGGKISTSGTGVVNLINNSTSTFNNVTSGSTINIPYNHALNIVGNLVDNGTITINSNMGGAIAAVNFSGGTLSGTGAFVLEEGSDDAQVNGPLTQAAGHSITGYGQINGPLINNGILNANAAGQTLVITEPVTGSGSLLVGASATMVIVPGTGLVQQGSVSVNATGVLDITNNRLAINYGAGNPSPLKTTILPEIISGYNSGAWNGPGIDSSSAAANHAYAVGYADGSTDPGTPAVAGQILLKYDLVGDTNLDGTVNLTDLLNLLNSYGQTGKDWAHGDTNYDGSVNLTDLLSLLNNYGGVSNGAQANFNSNQVVPEPVSGSVLLLAVGGTLMSRRRRVHNCNR